MNKYKPLSLAAILALIFTLSACSEQLLETVAEDPEPDTTSGEADYVTSQVLAQNTADNERSPQPNDITLGSYNGSDENESNDINGQSKLMPIRIPFSDAIPNLYDDDGSLNEATATSYVSNIAIIELPIIETNPSESIIVPLPANDLAGNPANVTIGDNTVTGTFKAVYQDSNHDLVLVPANNTLESSSPSGDTNYTYFVLVHKNLNGRDGQNIIPDTLTQLLTTSQKLIDENGIIQSTLLEDINDNGIANDENDTDSVESLELTRQAYVGENGEEGMRLIASSLGFNFTSASDIASVFHFTTSAASGNENGNDFSDFSDAVNGVLGAAIGVDIGAATIYPLDESIIWLNADMNATTTSRDNLIDTLSSDYNLSQISEVSKGFFTCTNFLENEGKDTATGADKWDLNEFAKLSKFVAGSVTSLADCPNSLSNISESLTGTVGFWAIKPTTTNLNGVVVFQHGILGNKDHLFSIANTLADYGFSSLAIDTWGHGERTYEDGDGDGTLENTMANSYADSGALFIRPDAPDLTAGYMWQTMIDMYRLAHMGKANSGIQDATGANGSTMHFIGVSLGGIHGASLTNLGLLIEDPNTSFSDPFNKYVLNVTGGDVGDVILNGSFGASVRASVARAQGIDTSTVAGQQSLNSTMVAIDLLAAHAVFGLATDPLALANAANPKNVLLQEITGDETVPNNNSELLTQAMALKSYNDGDEFVETDTSSTDHVQRLRWTFDPSNYGAEKDGDPAGHSFLLNGESNATDQGQLQVVCYLRDGFVLNPAATINPSSCSN